MICAVAICNSTGKNARFVERYCILGAINTFQCCIGSHNFPQNWHYLESLMLWFGTIKYIIQLFIPNRLEKSPQNPELY